MNLPPMFGAFLIESDVAIPAQTIRSLFSGIGGIGGNPVKGEVSILLKEYFFVIHFYVATRAPGVTLSKDKLVTRQCNYCLSEFQSVPENNVFLETRETSCK